MLDEGDVALRLDLAQPEVLADLLERDHDEKVAAARDVHTDPCRAAGVVLRLAGELVLAGGEVGEREPLPGLVEELQVELLAAQEVVSRATAQLVLVAVEALGDRLAQRAVMVRPGLSRMPQPVEHGSGGRWVWRRRAA